MKYYYVYILICSDGSFYVGITNNLDRRISEHNNPIYKSYTSTRLPIKLAKSFVFNQINEGINFEKKIKKWSRAKKQALIDNDWDLVRFKSMRKTKSKRMSHGSRASP